MSQETETEKENKKINDVISSKLLLWKTREDFLRGLGKSVKYSLKTFSTSGTKEFGCLYTNFFILWFDAPSEGG